ncbi:unnamed protein product [Acanthoscelides obtectus]|uniref:Uncharacterized protein n=1 Tax=Acanthoscelides obtectus TaxID=200917 RepID=A0A9P0LT87_ACAOB|nr:unnamed protein product [Acanthoscelides obtectus]CAK1625998.1 hypothetical protein AOBTE_LOCUS3534 [Acanthoscelides obtectus]
MEFPSLSWQPRWKTYRYNSSSQQWIFFFQLQT